MLTPIEMLTVVFYVLLMLGMYAAGYYSGRRDAKEAIRYARSIVRQQQKLD